MLIKGDDSRTHINITAQRDEALLAALRTIYSSAVHQLHIDIDGKWPDGKQAVLEETLRTVDLPDFPNIRNVIAQRVEQAATVCEQLDGC